MFKCSTEGLKSIFRDFYNLTHFMIVLYDSDRNRIYSYPENMCGFCESVRRDTTLATKCIDSDNIGFDICDKTRKPYIYKCHMSVVEAIAPIYANEILMGYLMFGQILCPEHNDVKEKAGKVFGEAETQRLLDEMTTADETRINSAVNMMTMCASYLYTNEIISDNPSILVDQLKRYIKSNLGEDLTIDNLCRLFYVSRTKLYKISLKNFGMGISDYIRKERIKKAKKLIRTTESPICEIAESVGIRDCNYFIRLFKKEEGITPLKYRKTRHM